MGLCCYTTYMYYGIGILAIGIIMKISKKVFQQRKLDRWNNTPKDVVILHAFPALKTLPNGSTFVLKVLTYLRMTKINYKLDTNDCFGPKGKSPWISLNGEHIADSQFIIEYLGKKFEKSSNGSYSEEQLAMATAVRVMLEEHAFWYFYLIMKGYGYYMTFQKLYRGVALDRFIFTRSIPQLMKGNAVYLWIMQTFVGWLVRRGANGHGIGRHSEKEIVQLVTKDLRAVSTLLGNKKFILGEEPCEDDCAIFGFLAQCVWGVPGSPYEKLINGELKNIKEYCIRMKEKFYADWDNCLQK